MTQKPSQRIYGFDLLRIATVMAILYFHVWQYSFFQDVISIPAEISNYHNLTGWVGDIFKYGGLFIVALSFFLIGLKEKSHHMMRFFVLIAGLSALQISTADNPMDPTTWDWDVYSYLVLSYIVVLLIPRKPVIRWPLVAVSVALLSVPYEQYGALLKIPEAVQFTGWNIVPWIALPILFHSAAVLWSQKFSDFVQDIRKWEWPVWFVLIVLFLIITPDYGPFPAGPGFESYVFKQKPLMFWKHFIVFMFFMRLSLTPLVNGTLAKLQGIKQFSNMAWNKHLGVCYFMHLAFIPMGIHMMDFWAQHPRAFDWFWLFIFISVEVIVRAMFALRLTLRAKVVDILR